MAELKPCPFCGGGAVLKKFHVSYSVLPQKYEGIAIRATCQKCGAVSPYKRSKMHGNFKDGEEAKAIEAWNRRTSDATD